MLIEFHSLNQLLFKHSLLYDFLASCICLIWFLYKRNEKLKCRLLTIIALRASRYLKRKLIHSINLVPSRPHFTILDMF